MKYLTLSLTLWKWEGYVCAGGSPTDFAAFVKHTIDGSADVGEYSAGHSYVEYGKPWMLWVQSVDDLPTLAHEALHITTGVLEGRGMKHSSESEEAYTYTMEGILRATLSARKSQWKRAE